MAVETYLESMFTSINHIHMKEIKGISKRIKEAQNIEKLPLKRLQSIKNSAMSTRVFTLKDLLSELSTRGVDIQKVSKLPDSSLTEEILLRR